MILFKEVEGNIGAVAFSQIVCVVPKLKVGVMFGFTVTEKVAIVAQNPSAGKNVYVSETVLLISEGYHVPVMLFTDVNGNRGAVSPEQMVKDVPKSKVGTVLLFTVTVNVMGDAQCPGEGVNVYTPELVLLTSDGFHVPLMPFVELGFKFGMASSPAQIEMAVPKSNVGITFGLTVTVNVVVVAHNPAVGVKV